MLVPDGKNGTCPSAEQLKSVADFEMPRVDREPLERHIAGCPECANAVRAFTAIGAGVRGLGGEAVPEGLRERILARLTAEAAVSAEETAGVPSRPGAAASAAPGFPGMGAPTARRRGFPWLGAGLAACAAVVVLVITLPLLGTGGTKSTDKQLAASPKMAAPAAERAADTSAPAVDEPRGASGGAPAGAAAPPSGGAPSAEPRAVAPAKPASPPAAVGKSAAPDERARAYQPKKSASKQAPTALPARDVVLADRVMELDVEGRPAEVAERLLKDLRERAVGADAAPGRAGGGPTLTLRVPADQLNQTVVWLAKQGTLRQLPPARPFSSRPNATETVIELRIVPSMQP